MASLNMAQLMSDDALKLIHIIRLRQETAVNPDDLSSGHKGVDFGIVDQQHLNIAWVQASRLFKWRGDTVEQRLRFRIPQICCDMTGRAHSRRERRRMARPRDRKTSELKQLMRISSAVLGFKKKK